ncbi:hypothetical protein [Roseimicrobium sp. ORNL1]|uniref:hypothetical protein n=1 Tax=Roseimicrobium sp. ORNL1 TaxID=2711231 RepID=UPI0013E1DAE0|nr:hypothetical protein [Roseimicrobium sp. ORNL1]QIF02044.1 hypothetical protein G5S37_11040 [Roseimicrobium sp. ORNL1]
MHYHHRSQPLPLLIAAFLTLLLSGYITPYSHADIGLGKESKRGSGRELTQAQVISLLAANLQKSPPETFISRSGKLYGMDSDTALSFRANNEVVLGEYGYTYIGYRGTYSVAADGVITLELKGYPKDTTWPAMKLVSDGKSNWLHPVTKKKGFIMGGRGGASESGDMNAFWPFKLVKSDLTLDVSPITTWPVLKYFQSPTLPEDFKWEGDSMEFRLDYFINENGTVTFEKHFTQDTESRTYAADDWRHPAVFAASEALKLWTFSPMLSDGKPIRFGNYLTVKLTRVDGAAHWVISENYNVIYDNMPRETSIQRDKQSQQGK